VAFNLLSNGIDGRVRPQKPICELLIFPQEAEQEMLRLDVRAAELAGLVPCEENYAPGFFRVTLKHLVWILPYSTTLYLKILAGRLRMQRRLPHVTKLYGLR
jgi:hypothetical protein